MSDYRRYAPDPRLRRLRLGGSRAWEVHAAVRGVERPFCTWLTSTSAARGFLRHVPKADYMQLATQLYRGVGLTTAAGICLARAHAARRIQGAYRLLQLRQLLLQYRVGRVQLEACHEAHKAKRQAARARARAGDVVTGQCGGQQETRARVAVVVDEGRAGERADGAGHGWRSELCSPR